MRARLCLLTFYKTGVNPLHGVERKIEFGFADVGGLPGIRYMELKDHRGWPLIMGCTGTNPLHGVER
jgi:hypothetical protein